MFRNRGVNCDFQCIWNWFSKANSRKKSANYWSGKNNCKHFNKTAKLFIKKEESSRVILDIQTSGGFTHEYIQKCRRVTGEYRKNLVKNAKDSILILVKYDPLLESTLIKINLEALNYVLDNFESSVNRRRNTLNGCDDNETMNNNLYSLINLLLVFKSLNNENGNFESLALTQRFFKDVCTKINSLFHDDDLDRK
ncbi:unnamed protein product, partial [Brachionus calyciflorus]